MANRNTKQVKRALAAVRQRTETVGPMCEAQGILHSRSFMWVYDFTFCGLPAGHEGQHSDGERQWENADTQQNYCKIMESWANATAYDGEHEDGHRDSDG